MRKQIIFILLVAIANMAQAQNFKEGEPAPKIVQATLSGETFDLDSLKGQVVLVDFWASWCSPCRKETPYILKAYNKYKDAEFKSGKGFTVVSISLDNNKAAWEHAIKKDDMIWPYHLSDLKGWKNAVAKKLGVKRIPASFLMDGDGKIVAINLRGKDIEGKLKKLSKSGSGWGSFW